MVGIELANRKAMAPEDAHNRYRWCGAGVVVMNVKTAGEAELLGLHIGDRLHSINGKVIIYIQTEVPCQLHLLISTRFFRVLRAAQEIGSSVTHKTAKERLRTAPRPAELVIERIDDDRMLLEETRTTNQVALHVWRLSGGHHDAYGVAPADASSLGPPGRRGSGASHSLVANLDEFKHLQGLGREVSRFRRDR